jgi:hypothetical protein
MYGFSFGMKKKSKYVEPSKEISQRFFSILHTHNGWLYTSTLHIRTVFSLIYSMLM